MTAVHPEVVEARLTEAGLARCELPLLGHELSLARAVIRELMQNAKHPVRGPRDTRRGGAFEMEVEREGRARVYRVEVTLLPEGTV